MRVGHFLPHLNLHQTEPTILYHDTYQIMSVCIMLSQLKQSDKYTTAHQS